MFQGTTIKVHLLVVFLSFFQFLNAQKAELMIVKHKAGVETDIQVLTNDHILLYDESLIPLRDTLFLRIDYEKRYYFKLNNFADGGDKQPLVSLYLNKIPLIIVHSDLEPGDYSWPFFSGVGKPELRIVGGNTASIQDYPWQVYVQAGDYLCGGTIIADKWVMTAAHCLFDNENNRIPDDEVSFIAGSDRPFNVFVDASIYDIEYSIIHEDYNSSNFANDLALLRTRDVIEGENIKPINLITNEDVSNGATDPGVLATITGWGLTNVEPLEFPDDLQSLEIPIVTQNLAQAIWGPLPENMLMAGYPDGRGDACRGDSGGPLIVQVGNEYKIAGITSWGSANCNSVGGYVRVSEFTEWLALNTGIGQGQFRTVRPAGSAFRCEDSNEEPTFRTYISDTLADAISYEWKIEPTEAGTLISNGNSAEVAWSTNFTGEAYVSIRALTPEGYTNYAGQRVIIGMMTEIKKLSQDTSVCYNSELTINVQAVGSDLNYNWYLNDQLLLSGKTPFIYIRELQESNEGIYQVEVVGSCGTSLSEKIEVNSIPLTDIVTSPEDQLILTGSSFSLDVEAVGDDLNFLWSRGNDLIQESKNSKLEIENVTSNETGLYSVRVDGTCGSKFSRQIYVYVDPDIQDFPDGVNIWPTLTRTYVNIAIDNNQFFDVYLYNSSGIYLGRLERQRYQTTLNLENYAPGIYYIEIKLRRESKIYKVVRVN